MSSPFKLDGVDDVTTGLGGKVKIVTLYGSAAITAGNAVAIDLDDSTYGLGASVEHSTVTGKLESLVCGIATETISAAGLIQIQVAGKYTGANILDTNAVAGDPLVATSVAGQLQDVVTATNGGASADFDYHKLGVCIVTPVSDSGTMLIDDRGWF